MILKKYFVTFILLISSGSAYSFQPLAFELPYNKWRLISLPATPPNSANTLEKILADDMGADTVYGDDWVVYSYNTDTEAYGGPVLLTDELYKGRGYWIIQVLTKEALP